jgi:hypothetical protein
MVVHRVSETSRMQEERPSGTRRIRPETAAFRLTDRQFGPDTLSVPGFRQPKTHAFRPIQSVRRVARRLLWFASNPYCKGDGMEMFLMVFALSLLGVAVSGALFAAATHGVDEPRALDAAGAARRAAVPARFFVETPAAGSRPLVPIDVLLLQIERHVRLEQAAAESFLHAPTTQSLHCQTSSPLMMN